MGVIATFDYATFIASYPEFSATPEPSIAGYWTMAEALHSNDGCGPVTVDNVQLQLMNLVTAHIAAQFTTPQGTPAAATGLVGAISSASEGSVSVSAQALISQSESASFWNATKYGALYWRMTLPYRTARYRSMYTRTGGVPPRP